MRKHAFDTAKKNVAVSDALQGLDLIRGDMLRRGN